MSDCGVGIYIHVPFCVKKCSYCDFYSVTESTLHDAFCAAVKKEMRFYARHGFFADRVCDTVYIGGGTPSVLGADRICSLIHDVRELFTVYPREITVEVNPDSTDLSFLNAVHDAGVNRISVGVQTFDDTLLAMLGRVHTAQQARDVCALVADHQFDSFSMDVIHSIPGQTREMYDATLREVFSYAPPHVSAYAMTVEDNTPLNAACRAGRVVLVGEAAELSYLEYTNTVFQEKGYQHYEISSYAKSPQTRSQHNSKYWNGVPYVGLGPSAHSFTGIERWSNVSDVKRYIEILETEALPSGAHEALDREAILLERIMLGLRRCVEGVRYAELDEVLADGRQFREVFSQVIGTLQQEGLVCDNDAQLRLTKKGQMVYNTVVQRFADEI